MSYRAIAVWSLLAIALPGVVFLAFPEIDLWAAGLLHSPEHGFLIESTALQAFVDDYRYRLALTCLAGVWTAQITVNWWRGLGPVYRWRAVVFVVLAFLVGPVLVANGVFKTYWDRARPNDIQAFGGDRTFSPALVISDQCERNCSFVAGDASFAFGFLAFALLAERRRRLWLAAAVGFGLFVGFLRMANGSHFLSDVLYAGIFVGICTVLLYKPLVGDAGSAVGEPP